MTIDQDKNERRFNRKVSEFSGHFMSNSKWLKLFKVISLHYPQIRRCLIVDIYHDESFEIIIPSADQFDTVFYAKGIKDVLMGGPMLFKEIRWIEIPENWPEDVYTQFRNAPAQNLSNLEQEINGIGEFVIERGENSLKVFGYK